MRGTHLGDLEELVLMAVAALSSEAYGLTVRELLGSESGRFVSLGAVHSTLYRLQDKGLLGSALGGASETRGGRRKRLFTITNAGIMALDVAHTQRQRLVERMPLQVRPGLSS